MPREDYRTKAVRYLGEGRLTVRGVGNPRIVATCRGDSAEVYRVEYDVDDGWSCTCPAKTRCAHMQALMLVTLRPGGDPA